MIWQQNVCGYDMRVVVSYAYALHMFPFYVQQLKCESHGKAVDCNGDVTRYGTSPMIVPANGPEAQHSFFQYLHQSKCIIPVEFISVLDNKFSKESGKQLLASFNAQQRALAEGRLSNNLNESFPGNRPSVHLSLTDLSPKSLGHLLAFYENKTVFEGMILNLNSFDQPGVQLGKDLMGDSLN